jgi:hypothetical protein
MNTILLSRRRLFLVLPALFVCHEMSAQSVEEKVAGIRARYNAIEGAKLRTKAIEFEAQDEPLSGTCTLHYQGEELVKIHLAYGAGDHGASDEYFYYTKGVLFFAYASDGSWGFTGATLPNGESETIDTVVEHRVYVENGAILKHLEKTASSKKPAELKGLLANAPNAPGSDTERAGNLLQHGLAAMGIHDAAGALKVLASE